MATNKGLVDELTEIFHLFDKNGNGALDRDELAQILKSTGEAMDDEEMRARH